MNSPRTDRIRLIQRSCTSTATTTTAHTTTAHTTTRENSTVRKKIAAATITTATIAAGPLVAPLTANAGDASGGTVALARERHGPGVFNGPGGTVGNGDTVVGFTPTLPLDAPSGEIILRDGNGAVLTTSGAVDDDWTVADGVLAPGGSYAWDALDTTGGQQTWVAPPVHHYKNGTPPMQLGATNAIVESVQAPQTFSVAAGYGTNGAASGLSTRFWPHIDPNELVDVDSGGSVDLLPGTMIPGAGSEVISSSIALDATHEAIYECIHTENPIISPNGGVNTTYIHCGYDYAFDATVTNRAAGADAAAHNIEGRNVAPSYQMTITDDQTVAGDGFVLSTAEEGIISAAYPVQTGFGYRMLGYIEVPKSGTYTFGTTSPAGARAYLYDTTADDLGKFEISAADAWSPADLGTTCAASSNRLSFENPFIAQHGGGTYNEYKYEDGEPDWYQFPAAEWASLATKLRTNCTLDTTVRWGQPVELEAGTLYPIDVAGWVGVAGGEISLHVDGPGTEAGPVPTAWLTPAPSNVIDFERSITPASTLDGELLAWSMNGYGDELVGIDPDRGVVSYAPDGLGGWSMVGQIPGVVELPTTGYTVTTGQGRLDRATAPGTPPMNGVPVDSASGTIEIGLRQGQLVDGQITASGSTSLGMLSRNASLTVDALRFDLDADGVITGGEVDGGLYSSYPAGTTSPLRSVEGELREDGTVRLVLRNQHQMEMAELFLPAVAADDVRPAGPTSFSMNRSGVRIHNLTPTSTGPARAVTLANGAGSLNGTFTAKAQAGDTWPTFHDLTINSLTFELDSDGSLIDPQISGSMRTVDLYGGSETNPSLTALSGRLDPNTMRLELESRAGFRPITMSLPVDIASMTTFPQTAIASSDYGDTVVVASDPTGLAGNGAGDVALITKPTGSAPLGTDNVDVVWISELYDQAGESAPNTVGALPQAVQITPDGLLVGVLQPVADGGHRVDLFDRSSLSAPWQRYGSFDVDRGRVATHATVPFAIGRDGLDRFVAIASADTVTVANSRNGTWSTVATHPTAAAATSLSFDYFAEHLAIGEPTVGTVTVLERNGNDWTLDTTLQPSDGGRFGSAVSYSWGLLTVTTDGTYSCAYPDCGAPGTYTPGSARMYRDADGHWGEFGSWFNVELGDGTGPTAALAQGGTAVAPRLAAATVGTLNIPATSPGLI
ncbi:MAG: hypothetical protein AAFY28_12865 [Actinomycetota bacterium]